MVTDVLFANGLTLAFIYALFRLRRNEGDMKAIGLFLACCAVSAVIVLAEMQEAPQSDRYSSSAPLPDQK